MKKYELLNMEIDHSADVITTSADVTTDEIPWKTTEAGLYQLD